MVYLIIIVACVIGCKRFFLVTMLIWVGRMITFARDNEDAICEKMRFWANCPIEQH